jgi:glycosyltransferase involved in cell wall biosynthesis
VLAALRARFEVHYAGFLQPELDEAEARRRLEGCASLALFPEPARSKAGKVWLGLRTLASPWPVTLAKYRLAPLAAHVRAWMRDHPAAVVYADHLHMGPYLFVDAADRGQTQTAAPSLRVLDEHNVESTILERLAGQRSPLSPARGYLWLQARRMRRCESMLAARADRVQVVSESDADALLRIADCGKVERDLSDAKDKDARPAIGDHRSAIHNPQSTIRDRPSPRIHVVPNGVDLAFYEQTAPDRRPDDGRLIFVGSMNWLPNQDAVGWFAREVLPRLVAAEPSVDWRLDVVGQSPPTSVRALAGDRVRVTGTVEDVRPYLGAAAACVVPLRVAGGSRLKILEAFAAGVPVVSTRIGCEGLRVEDGRHLLIAETADDFVRALARLRETAGLAAALVCEGRRRVEAGLDWQTIGETMAGEFAIAAAGIAPAGAAAPGSRLTSLRSGA